MTYAAQTEPLKFLLHHVIGLEGLLAAGHSGADPADVDAVLEEAGRLAVDVLSPLDAIGDKTGAKLENGVVTTVPGWVDAYRSFAEGGWVGVAADPEHGGQGLPLAVASAVTELWSSANMAFGLCPMLSQAAIEVLEAYGSPAQKAKYLAPLVEGRWTGTMNLTEPQAGSDLSAVRAKATPENGHYRISGQKIYITYGEHDMTPNILHLVLARLPDGPPGIKGISLFLVPKFLVNDAGEIGARNDIRCAGIEHKLGI
ncbi:MAG: acyl-CoA dehydrogenase family protein, partial [Elsteraceae bacterium]